MRTYQTKAQGQAPTQKGPASGESVRGRPVQPSAGAVPPYLRLRAGLPPWEGRGPVTPGQADGLPVGASGELIRRAAEKGVQTPSTRLPYGEQIQKAFGRHDISGVQAHLGSAARGSAEAMNARAFATGEHVVFGGGTDLQTAAHEAAHVVQQRSGLQLAGGVGQVGDRYERHADAVASAVVRGESAEALLDQISSGAAAVRSAPVQPKLKIGERTPAANLEAFLTFLNTLSYGAFLFSVDGERFIAVQEGDLEQLRGLPPELARKVRQFGIALGSVLRASAEVTIDMVAGSRAIIGDFDTQQIDLGDMQSILASINDENRGDDPIDVYSMMIHEITEQYYKQAHGFDYEKAHGKALQWEQFVSGYKRIDEKVLSGQRNPDGTYSVVKELVFQSVYDPEEVKVIHLHVERSQVAKVEEVKRSGAGDEKEEVAPEPKSALEQFLADWSDEEDGPGKDGSGSGPANTQMKRSTGSGSPSGQVVQFRWNQDPRDPALWFEDIYYHTYNRETRRYYSKDEETTWVLTEEEASIIEEALGTPQEGILAHPEDRVLFGHGWIDPKKKMAAPRTITFYGPFGSTLTRAVSKWIRERGPVPPGALREISNGEFEALMRKYGGSCPSFARELWESARPSEYPRVVDQGDEIPMLSLERQTEEAVDPAEHVLTVKYFTTLEKIAEMTDELAHLHWATCLQMVGKDVEGKDITVLLDPVLSEQVYPYTPMELLRERLYQERMEPEEQPEPAPMRPQAPDVGAEIPAELQQILRTRFKKSDDLDEQAEAVRTLATEHGQPFARLMRFLSSIDQKGTPKG